MDICVNINIYMYVCIPLRQCKWTYDKSGGKIPTLTVQFVVSFGKQPGGNCNDILPSSTGLHIKPADGTEISLLLGLTTTAKMESLLIHPSIIGTCSFSSYQSEIDENDNAHKVKHGDKKVNKYSI